MTRPDLTVLLVRASAALQECAIEAIRLGDRDLADACRDEGVRVLKLIGRVVTNRPVEEVQS